MQLAVGTGVITAGAGILATARTYYNDKKMEQLLLFPITWGMPIQRLQPLADRLQGCICV